MPRNGSGVYSKPAGTTAVPNTTIESAKFNQVVDDIAQDLNFPRPITAGGTGASSVAAAQTALSVDNKVTFTDKNANYTAVATDNNAVLFFSATATLTLTAAATLGTNWHVTVIADGGAVTIDPNGSETINGAATLVLPAGTSCEIICNGTDFKATFGFSNGLVPIGKAVPLVGINQVDWTNLGGFTYLELKVSARANAAVTSGILFGRVSLDNGVSFESLSSDYAYSYWGQEGTASGSLATAPSPYLSFTKEQANLSSLMMLTMRMGNFNKASSSMFKCDASFARLAGSDRQEMLYGYYGGNVVKNAFRFGCTGGAFSEGFAELFGIRG
ncbi:hypothetical protein FY145_01015 [Agrobacterium tumefaciens]|nr:hypothetical protein [Agrobacterium tumefaciens]UXS69157.1 hypothetical protein FY146_01015 [Agrobacterium tumefaciens]UXS76820.1 hypothetical protein FY145_01015 [Agrobacterium tumefaciens]